MTTFHTPLGPHRLTWLPQGYTNAVADYQNTMSFLLQDKIPDVAGVFIDDVGIKGDLVPIDNPNWMDKCIPANPGIRAFVWKHAQNVNRVFHCVACSGGTFSAKKTQIAMPEVLIVGQLCTTKGCVPDGGKVAKILKWPVLDTVTQVCGFLCLCGTLHIWIPSYSMRIRPLVKLTRKEAELEWGDEQQNAFEDMKVCVTNAPVLRPLDYRLGRPILLSVDTSYIAIGYILSQEDETGQKHPVRYGSLPINDCKSRYSQAKLELYRLYRALQDCKYWIVGVTNLKVELDAKYVPGMIQVPDIQPSAAENRWIQGILRYDFKVVHVPAERHKGPDTLSRRPLTESELEKAEEINSDDDMMALVRSVLVLQNTQGSRRQQIDTLRDIHNYLQDPHELLDLGTTSCRRFLNKVSCYMLDGKDLYKRKRRGLPRKVIFDLLDCWRILTEAHEGFGHHGVHAVFETLWKRFTWPYMFQDVSSHVKSCHECQLCSTKKPVISPHVSQPATKFSKIYVDVMDMPKGKGGFKYIVAARNDVSQAAEGRALRMATAHNIAMFLWEDIICHYGAIAEIVTNNRKEFEGACALLIQKYSILHIRISPYNSRANGVVERGHFVIREGIMKSCKKATDWPDLVPHAFFADKMMPCQATGFTPFYLLHGVDGVMPLDLTEATFLVRGFRTNMPSEDLLSLQIRQLEKRPRDLASAAKSLYRMCIWSKEAFEWHYAHKLRSGDYSPGTLVLVRNSMVEKSHSRKSKPRYFGPFEIVRRTQGGSYVLKEMDGVMH
jgi:hypothetical protein